MVYAVQHPFTGELIYPPNGRCWTLEQMKVLANMEEWAPYELREIDDAERRAEICGVAIEDVPVVKALMLSVPLHEARKMAEKRLAAGNWPMFYFSSGGQGGIRIKKHLDTDEGEVPTTLWPADEVGTNTEANLQLKDIFGGRYIFSNPKPSRLIERVLEVGCPSDGLVLNSFAGSGTTAQAVLDANERDHGTRRFVLVEMMDYSDSITAERVRRSIHGYPQGHHHPLRAQADHPRPAQGGRLP